MANNDLKNLLLEKESEGEVVKDFQLKINLILEMFYLNSILNFGIPPVLVFQLEVYYKLDRLLIGLTAQLKGTPA